MTITISSFNGGEGGSGGGGIDANRQSGDGGTGGSNGLIGPNHYRATHGGPGQGWIYSQLLRKFVFANFTAGSGGKGGNG